MVAILVSLPLHGGAAVLPAAVAYLTVFIGLAVWPGWWFESDYSYGVYLYQSPVLLTLAVCFPATASLPWWFIGILALTLALMIASLSWRIVERPSLNQKRRAIAAANGLLAWRPRSVRK